MDLRTIQAINAQRAVVWHADGTPWTGLEWAGAMCGEAGEAANIAKKLRRLECGIDGNSRSGVEVVVEHLCAKLAKEIADTMLYLLLLAEHYNIDAYTAVVEVFNTTSIEMNYPHRIG